MQIPFSQLNVRPYQQRIISQALATLLVDDAIDTQQSRSVLIESPTGSGKTFMGLVISKLMQLRAGARVGWVAMRRNLLDQVQFENRKYGIDVDMIPISMFDRNPPRDIDLLVVDEAQHDAASSCAHIHNTIKSRWILGLSATPYRADRIRLCFDKVIRDAGIHRLIQDGFLSPFDHYTIPNWQPRTVAEFYANDVDRWGKSIFFFHNLRDCETFASILLKRGLIIEIVTGSSDRERQLGDFRSGCVNALVNCMVLTEGFDDPTIKTVWIRPSSKGPTLQMAGRVLRLCDDHPIKQVVQCNQTPQPFTKFATARHQYTWDEFGWRSLTLNPGIDACSQFVLKTFVHLDTQLPKFFSRKRRSSRYVPTDSSSQD